MDRYFGRFLTFIIMILTHRNNYEYLEASGDKWITNGTIYTKAILCSTENFNYIDWQEVDVTPDDEEVTSSEVLTTINSLLQ